MYFMHVCVCVFRFGSCVCILSHGVWHVCTIYVYHFNATIPVTHSFRYFFPSSLIVLPLLFYQTRIDDLSDLSNSFLRRPPHTPLPVASDTHAHIQPSILRLTRHPPASAEMHLAQAVGQEFLQEGTHRKRIDPRSGQDADCGLA